MAAAAALLAACAAAPPAWQGAAYAPRPGGRLDVPAVGALGRALFFEPSLSASGRVSCASCHDPRLAFGPSNDLPVQRAGRDGTAPGLRAAPSLRYLQAAPPFAEHRYENEGDDSIDTGPAGGYTWDGRASSVHDQARLPLLSPAEMANGSPAEVVARIERGPLAGRMRQVFGVDVFADRDAAFAAALMALEVYQQLPAEFYPYSSRYDEVLRGRATLSAQEAKGLALFNSETKGNCASCHPSVQTADGAFPLFTDFGLVALGVPRRADAAAGADLGLCGPLRTDFADRPEYCGLFRTPTLRNVALRRVFFHNGVFRSLDEVLRFYARRDSHPQSFYPRGADGAVQKFDDLPPAYHGNVNHDAPFGRTAGEAPALDDEEIAAIVAFLKTLTDADLVGRTAVTMRPTSSSGP